MFHVASNGFDSGIDEIANFQNARWVSPVEATWRIFGFPLNGIYPTVLQLQVHLPNFQIVQFEDDDDLEDILHNERLRRTMITQFFITNSTDEEAKNMNLIYKEFPSHYVWDVQMHTWTKRKQGKAIGRLCAVSPVENERYYLRILVNNIRCPTLYESLLMVNSFTCASFQEAAYKRGLLHNDDDIEKTMEEAAVHGMPSELRRLFATLLHYCKPTNPKKLFLMFYEHMVENFKRNQRHTELSDHDILCKVLESINDTLESLGRHVNEFRLVSFKYTCTDFQRYMREIAAERGIQIPDEDLAALYQLNKEQRYAFDVIFYKAMKGDSGMFFIDGPGGTGKSFLYKVLLAHVRSNGFIAIIVASSGIASSSFLGGRTAHSRFKIPINAGPNVKCLIPFQSGEADSIRSSKIIIWDEAPMADKSVIQALDKLLRDLCENVSPFGGNLIVLGGDFRQVLPVVKGGSRSQQIDASIVNSQLWKHFTKIVLTDNMRVRDDPQFIEYLMRIGNGEEPTNERGEVEIPKLMMIPYTNLEESLESLISYVYPDMDMFETCPLQMMQRIILSPKNEFVDDINGRLIKRLPGEEVVYISDDRAKSDRDQGDYIDYLNSLEPKGMPQHILVLKVNSPVFLLRNIDPIEGLCNDTRLICKNLSPNVVGAVIDNGQFKGKHVWIPRIPLEPNPSDNKYIIPFVRRQIPLRLSFVMTINKAQGQTLDCVGIYLKQSVFTHGQFYVSISRARSGRNVRILIVPPTCQDPETRYTSNVVYQEILVKAGLR